MERVSFRKFNAATIATLSATALSGCTISIDSYLSDPSIVKCDGRRTKVELEGDGIATFVVHGKESDDVAIVKVRRLDNEVSVNTSGDVTGPDQEQDADGYTPPTLIVDGSELSTFGAGGAWVIDAREDSVVIQGSCDGI